jgi:CheY-like chemotaxis protein
MNLETFLETCNDPTFWIYGLTGITSFLGFLLFSWWWWKNRRASAMYAYITVLYASIAFMMSINAYARHLRCQSIPEFHEFTSTTFWSLRVLFLSFVVLAIFLHVFSKILVALERRKFFFERRHLTPDEEFKYEIMIVDDHEAVVHVLKKGLHMVFPNIVIHHAHTGEDALKMFGKNININFVLTDLYLPMMNGFELCETIKRECPWTVLIAMTGYPLNFELLEARRYGFDDYLQKPFKVSEIIDVARREFSKLEKWKKIRDNKTPNERIEKDASTIG